MFSAADRDLLVPARQSQFGHPAFLLGPGRGDEIGISRVHDREIAQRTRIDRGGLVGAVVMRLHAIPSARHHRRNADAGVAEIVVGGAAVLDPMPRPADHRVVFRGQPQDQGIDIRRGRVRIHDPGMFGARQVIEPGRRVDTHRGHGSLGAVHVVFEVIVGAVALAHPQHPDRTLGPRQFALLDEPVNRPGRMDDRRHAGGIVVRALLE